MSILLYRLRKRGALLFKILIGLFIASIPGLLLLQRMDFVRLGIAPPVKIKTYSTLETRREKMRRGEIWFKMWAYSNARYVYTDILFGCPPEKIKRYEWGQVPLQNTDQPRADLALYRLCICLSQLNQRVEGIALCDQFESEFSDSSYLDEVRRLRQELVARQL